MVDAGTNCAKKIIKLINKQQLRNYYMWSQETMRGDGFIIGNYLHKKNYKVKIFCLQKKYYKGDALKALQTTENQNSKYFKIQS